MWKTTWRHNVDNMRQKDIKTYSENMWRGEHEKSDFFGHNFGIDYSYR
jgi:hypothetical protein